MHCIEEPQTGMDQTKKIYPSLTRSYKGFYPFTLATTSFIYPDDYVPNVSLLGSYFDEIELLLFESRDIESLFPNSIVDELNRLAQDLNIGYNVHLPTDISISAPDVRPRISVKLPSSILSGPAGRGTGLGRLMKA